MDDLRRLMTQLELDMDGFNAGNYFLSLARKGKDSGTFLHVEENTGMALGCLILIVSVEEGWVG